MIETKNMPNIKLSCVIPSWKDPLLHKTIDSLLDNSELGNDLEIIVVLDGYWARIKDDDRIRVVHLGKNRGMRDAINAGVSVSRGEFIMRTDEHCMYAKGYDRILTDTCKNDWIVTARRYYLDTDNWKVMDLPYVDYEKLAIQTVGEGKKFSGVPWDRPDRKDIMIDETEALQGSMWIANREYFLKVVGELQTEGYGPLIQDSVEITMKYWQSGGKLIVNKNTWFAHKHVSFPRTHQNGTPENPARNEEGYAYSFKKWENYYRNTLRPQWNAKYAKGQRGYWFGKKKPLTQETTTI